MTDNDKALEAVTRFLCDESQIKMGGKPLTDEQLATLKDSLPKYIEITEARARGLIAAYQAALPKGQESGLIKDLTDLSNLTRVELLANDQLVRTVAFQASVALTMKASEADRERARAETAEAQLSTLRQETVAEALKLIAPWKNQAQMLLQVGEMTAQERRTAVAIINAIEASIRALAPLPVQGSGK